MAYKEPKLDREGAQALYDALTKMNDGNTKSSTKKNQRKKPLRNEVVCICLWSGYE